jgi:dihydrofolate reductase
VKRISLVVAMADNGVIGRDGALPWRIPEDMRHFKALTIGKPCIMGRKTWQSLPKRPLPERTNIVITRDKDFHADGAAIVHSWRDALVQAGGADEVCVIGGAEVYKQALQAADRIYLTEVHINAAGAARIDSLNRKQWHEKAREEHVTADGLRYSYVTLERSA